MRSLFSKLKIAAPLICLSVLTISCQDTYEEDFQNPEEYTEAKVKYLFTQRQQDGWNKQYDMSYFEGWYLIYQDVASWSHITGRPNDRNMMRPNIGRWEGQVWNDFYTNAAPRTQEAWEVWNEQSQEAKEKTRLYLTLMSILDAHWGSIITDLWGPIPWHDEESPAFRVRQGADIHPEFDDQSFVYSAILDSLGQASETLRNGDFTRPSDLNRQDVLFDGDLMTWERYANSLRLRLAMRMHGMNESRAQEIVNEILTNGYPIVESNDQNVWWDLGQTQTDVTSGGRKRAFSERTFDRSAVFAPDIMIELAKEHDDPRMDMLFDPNSSGDYVGLPYSPADQPQNPNRETHAIPDSALYTQQKFPAMIATAPEMSFLKAEAYQRGWASGNARAAFEQGLRQSVDMWHTVYNMNPDTSIARPDQAAIDDFVASALSSFDESPMKAIAMQRYFHFNHAQPYQAWSSQRRFDIPSLPDPELESGQTLEGVVMRVPYPTTESQNNDNFDQVSDITRFETVAWDTEKHVK